MSDKPTTSLKPKQPVVAPVAKTGRKKRGLLKRCGCALLLICWFALLLTPCGLFYLAANGEIRLNHADIPQPHEHPWLLISLVSESDDRGLRIESSSIMATGSESELTCVETMVRFLLWEASESNQDVHYCDCYQRSDADTSWRLEKTYRDVCSQAGSGAG